ncbi:MAG: hypothetical protein ACREBJ_06525 [Nitrosotalea sp.]
MKTLHLLIIIIASGMMITTVVVLQTPHIKIKIDGLNDTYSVGTPIDFFVTAESYGKFCAGPEVSILDATNQSNEVWWGASPAYTGMYCDPHQEEFTFHAGAHSEFSPHTNLPIILNKTGQYIVKARLGNTVSEKEFSIVPVTLNQINNTSPNVTTSLPKGAQVDLRNVSVWTCGAGRKIATFVDTSGFANITKANEPDKGLPLDWNDFCDFVSKPNSTGYINMSFEFTDTIQSSIEPYPTISGFFNKTAIYTLDDPYSPHANNLDGISIFATNIENVTDHTLKLTYVIKISPSAKEGTYGLGIPYTCPIELLTVGNHSYTGPMPWHRSIY